MSSSIPSVQEALDQLHTLEPSAFQVKLSRLLQKFLEANEIAALQTLVADPSISHRLTSFVWDPAIEKAAAVAHSTGLRVLLNAANQAGSRASELFFLRACHLRNLPLIAEAIPLVPPQVVFTQICHMLMVDRAFSLELLKRYQNLSTPQFNYLIQMAASIGSQEIVRQLFVMTASWTQDETEDGLFQALKAALLRRETAIAVMILQNPHLVLEIGTHHLLLRTAIQTANQPMICFLLALDFPIESLDIYARLMNLTAIHGYDALLTMLLSPERLRHEIDVFDLIRVAMTNGNHPIAMRIITELGQALSATQIDLLVTLCFRFPTVDYLRALVNLRQMQPSTVERLFQYSLQIEHFEMTAAILAQHPISAAAYRLAIGNAFLARDRAQIDALTQPSGLAMIASDPELKGLLRRFMVQLKPLPQTLLSTYPPLPPESGMDNISTALTLHINRLQQVLESASEQEIGVFAEDKTAWLRSLDTFLPLQQAIQESAIKRLIDALDIEPCSYQEFLSSPAEERIARVCRFHQQFFERSVTPTGVMGKTLVRQYALFSEAWMKAQQCLKTMKSRLLHLEVVLGVPDPIHDTEGYGRWLKEVITNCCAIEKALSQISDPREKEMLVLEILQSQENCASHMQHALTRLFHRLTDQVPRPMVQQIILTELDRYHRRIIDEMLQARPEVVMSQDVHQLASVVNPLSIFTPHRVELDAFPTEDPDEVIGEYLMRFDMEQFLSHLTSYIRTPQVLQEFAKSYDEFFPTQLSEEENARIEQEVWQKFLADCEELNRLEVLGDESACAPLRASLGPEVTARLQAYRSSASPELLSDILRREFQAKVDGLVQEEKEVALFELKIATYPYQEGRVKPEALKKYLQQLGIIVILDLPPELHTALTAAPAAAP